jgi:hypothetical protein
MQITKVGRTALGLFSNLLVVLLGTAILSSALRRSLWHPRSIQALLRVSYCYDIFVALLLGFIIYRRFKSKTAKWLWIIAGMWLILRAATLLGSSSSLWSQLSGMGCANGLHNADCMNWFLFTMPFVRAAAYSSGAWLCSRFWSPEPSVFEDGLIGKFHRPEWTAVGDQSKTES